MYKFCLFFLLFYLYSILGWIVECIHCSLIEKKIIYNRGFLIGPYCPIYGYGAMYMYLFLNRYYNDPIVLFIMGVVGTSLIEYLTSFFMEKVFKARWWDYSNRAFNLEGRICLKNAVLFGILGLLLIYIVNPFFLSLFKTIPVIILEVISAILFILFVTDNMVTLIIMMKLRKNLASLKKDSTSDLDKQIRDILANSNFFVVKIFKSFPRIKIKLQNGEKIIVSIQKTLDNFDTLRKERRNKVKEIKQQLKNNN